MVWHCLPFMQRPLVVHCQTNLVIAFRALSGLLCHFINTAAYHWPNTRLHLLLQKSSMEKEKSIICFPISGWSNHPWQRAEADRSDRMGWWACHWPTWPFASDPERRNLWVVRLGLVRPWENWTKDHPCRYKYSKIFSPNWSKWCNCYYVIV